MERNREPMNGVIRLVRAYLNAGIMDGGVVIERDHGTPEGGLLSPLFRELRAMGASVTVIASVASNNRRWWRNSAKSLNGVLTIAWFDRLGLPRLA